MLAAVYGLFERNKCRVLGRGDELEILLSGRVSREGINGGQLVSQNLPVIKALDSWNKYYALFHGRCRVMLLKIFNGEEIISNLYEEKIILRVIAL